MHGFRVAILVLFFLSTFGVIYAYALYPALLWCAARLFGRERIAADLPDAQLPSIAFLIAAHDEQAVIAQRIENIFAMDYPRDRMEVLIASDGSTDQTAQIVTGFAGRGVRLLDFPARRGKASVLNDAFRQLAAEIVLLSDANTCTDPDAARKLVRWFDDPNVGAVCGKLVLTDPTSGKNVDGLYWRYETFLKRNESRLGALLGSNGAIYALRRQLFRPIPANTIIDDFVIPLLAKQESGCDIVFDPLAIAREETAPDVAGEFHRRSRIGAGGWQAIGLLWPLLNPARGWIAFTFSSHKLLRWICPFLLILSLVATGLLSRSPTFRVLLGFQLALYAVALFGEWLPRRGVVGRLIKLVQMFAGMNLALLVGFFRWVSMPQTGMWNRTQREAEVRDALSASAVATQS